MKAFALVAALFLKIIIVENRMLPKIVSIPTELEQAPLNDNPDQGQEDGNPHERVIGLKNNEDTEESAFDAEKMLINTRDKRPCAIVIMSNAQIPNMQSLLRKYRYDSNGVLIPSSVQYFIKFPQGEGPPLLVPLNDREISPYGGFLRYYKEVPPIPQSWQH